MRNLGRIGVAATFLLFSFGCAGEQPVSTEAETEALYESPDYEKQMLGETPESAPSAEEATPSANQ